MTFNRTEYVEGIKNIGQTLTSHKVEYLIVGGAAIAFYGAARPSAGITGNALYDIDIWYHPTSSNFHKLLKAILSLNPEFKEDLDVIVFDPQKTFIKFDRDIYLFDFLTELKAFSYKDFAKCYERREIGTLENVELSFISKEDLIRDKEALARDKDLADAENLKKNSMKGFSR